MNQMDIVDILNSELDRRCKSNPLYSLRAFARTLGVSPANLSLVLNRKRAPSAKTVGRVLECLALTPLQQERIFQSLSGIRPDFQDNVSLETIEKVASWQSYAILSLIKTKDFKTELRWISARLGIAMQEAKSSVEALKAVGLLMITAKGWKRSQEGLRYNNLVTTAISQSFQRQLLAKAVQSMENDPMAARDLTSMTFAMSPGKMKEAKEEIRKFRLKMAEIFEEPGTSTDVYNLTVQFVPVTKEIKTK